MPGLLCCDHELRNRPYLEHMAPGASGRAGVAHPPGPGTGPDRDPTALLGVVSRRAAKRAWHALEHEAVVRAQSIVWGTDRPGTPSDRPRFTRPAGARPVPLRGRRPIQPPPPDPGARGFACERVEAGKPLAAPGVSRSSCQALALSIRTSPTRRRWASCGPMLSGPSPGSRAQRAQAVDAEVRQRRGQPRGHALRALPAARCPKRLVAGVERRCRCLVQAR